MGLIRKSQIFEEIPSYNKEYWWSKPRQERLDSALELTLWAKKIYKANPANTSFEGTVILKSRSPIDRKRFMTFLSEINFK